ncbi:MAG TPA: hypothetical protein PLB55_22425 [Prosthecobacter sp.]|nr:hypothetical protein [Prosthecobacter sp.]
MKSIIISIISCAALVTATSHVQAAPQAFSSKEKVMLQQRTAALPADFAAEKGEEGALLIVLLITLVVLIALGAYSTSGSSSSSSPTWNSPRSLTPKPAPTEMQHLKSIYGQEGYMKTNPR